MKHEHTAGHAPPIEHGNTPMSALSPAVTEVAAEQPAYPRLARRLMAVLEVVAAALMILIVVLLLGGVMSRYLFSLPVVWIDEVVSLSFLWVAMIGAAIAMHRNE